ncbi:MAG: hypothetical protein R3B47_15365 [Bacteroidia bacterium]
MALVLARQDTVVGGTLTDENGKFVLIDVRPAVYSLQIRALG